MPTTLLLRLPAPGQVETEWLVVDPTGAPTGPRQRGPLSLAAAVAGSAKVVVLAPATQILLAQPDLPPGSGIKLARAVPFALEEQLTEDIDQLYFAIGRRSTGGGTPVAVVARAVIEGWLGMLKAAGIEPDAMYPDMSLLPDNPGQAVLWLENERLAVRRPGMLPFAVELEPVTEALTVAGLIADPNEAVLEPKPLESAVLYVTREDWLRVQDEFENLIDKFESLKIQLLPDGPLPWLGRVLGDTDAVNLLQGEFATATDYGARWQQWRVAAFLAVGLLCAHLAAQALQIHRANKQSAALDGEIAQIFASAMPSETPQDPRRQMQSRLDRIRKSDVGPQYFLRSMQALSGAIAAIPQTSVDALSFRDQTLDLKVMAPSVGALAQLSQAIDKQGLTAEIQSSTPVGTGVEAHLQLKAAGGRTHK
jgi:general secretion pathway protein L